MNKIIILYYFLLLFLNSCVAPLDLDCTSQQGAIPPMVERKLPLYVVDIGDARVTESVRQWNEFIGKEILIPITNFYDKKPNSIIVFVRYVDSIEDFKGECVNNNHILGCTYYINDVCTIQILDNVDVSETTKQNVYTHELGHCLGFGHSTCPSCIMYPITTDQEFINSELADVLNNELDTQNKLITQ